MITTIQLKTSTVKILKKLREQMNVKSYDEAIKKLVVRKPKKSFWGAGGSISMSEIMRDLRDKKDRF